MANLVVHFEIHGSEPQRLIDFYSELFGWSFTQFGDMPYWSIDTGEGVYRPAFGIVVKNYINQSQEFALCAVALAYPAFLYFREGKTRHAVVLVGIALAFLVNMAFTSVSRTTMVTMPVMLAVFALLHLRLRTSLLIFCAAAKNPGKRAAA